MAHAERARSLAQVVTKPPPPGGRMGGRIERRVTGDEAVSLQSGFAVGSASGCGVWWLLVRAVRRRV